ncbi:hypothetical protein BHE74_00045762 [Ensete ventricosum]|nr:hypothetical protein GW17_00042110 [Ensete ventricosum]RWW48186.1 hypothetical protein BHE74_00045762 [Ensete ventricosum]RZS17727.1 hypothetical protein BHM03_00049914 [Ensete ventricosum]
MDRVGVPSRRLDDDDDDDAPLPATQKRRKEGEGWGNGKFSLRLANDLCLSLFVLSSNWTDNNWACRFYPPIRKRLANKTILQRDPHLASVTKRVDTTG